MLLAEELLQKETFANTGEKDCENLFNLGRGTPEAGENVLVYETDLSVRTQIEELPMLREFHSAARISEYVCDLEYLFSRMNVGSYGATEPHLWLMRKIPTTPTYVG